MAQGPPELLSSLLKQVSRSFYLTLRVLPGAIRSQIGLAYLLARATDTIADTDAFPKDTRLQALAALQSKIEGSAGPPLDLSALAGHQSSPAERVLLQRMPEALELLARFDPEDQARIRKVLKLIVSGQTLDLERFADADVHHVLALESDAELDDYTYRVAGCVGEFWTSMCRARLFPHAKVNDELLMTQGVRFGKGLQLVNVLRDLAADLQIGRCYLPRLALRGSGLQPADLLDPVNEPRFRQVYSRFLDLAEQHLEAGWAYTNHLPRRHVRVRLACAWPILIGMQTVAKLRVGPVLDPAVRVKISRSQVRSVMFHTLLWYGWPQRWHGLLQNAKHQGGKPLPQPSILAK